MKFLITGGKGFIGSYIVEQLSREHQVTVLDSSDTYGILSKEELFKLYEWRQRNWTKVTMINGDICNLSLIHI